MLSRTIVVITIALGLFSCRKGPKKIPTYTRSEAAKRRIKTRVAKLVGQARLEDARRYEAVLKLMPTLRFSETPCSVAVKALLGDPKAGRVARRIKALRSTSLIFPGTSGANGHFETQLSSLTYKLDDRLEQPYQRVDDLAREVEMTVVAPLAHDLLLYVHKLIQPRANTKSSFKGGYIKGALFVWSQAEKRIVCGALVGASSSDSVTAHGGIFGGPPSRSTANAAVLGDLANNAIMQGVSSLRELAPTKKSRQ